MQVYIALKQTAGAAKTAFAKNSSDQIAHESERIPKRRVKKQLTICVLVMRCALPRY
jgi:hypothetical protein